MAAYRNNNNRRYWPRSTILSAPAQIVANTNPNRSVVVLTTAAANTQSGVTHPAEPTGAVTIIVTRVAVRTIQ